MSAPSRHDLASRDDVRRLVATFYAGIDRDPALGQFFAGVDWAVHLPRMEAFWSAVALHEGGYRGRPMEAHARLEGLRSEHFEAWLTRFRGTVDTLFEGPTAEAAEAAEARAAQIAAVFQIRLGIAPDGSGPEVSLPLAAPAA